MEEQLKKLELDFNTTLEWVSSSEDLKNLEQDYLGKKGKLKAILAGVKDLSIEEKKTIGVAANQMKNTFIETLKNKAQEIEDDYFSDIEKKEKIDVTIW